MGLFIIYTMSWEGRQAWATRLRQKSCSMTARVFQYILLRGLVCFSSSSLFCVLCFSTAKVPRGQLPYPGSCFLPYSLAPLMISHIWFPPHQSFHRCCALSCGRETKLSKQNHAEMGDDEDSGPPLHSQGASLRASLIGRISGEKL